MFIRILTAICRLQIPSDEPAEVVRKRDYSELGNRIGLSSRRGYSKTPRIPFQTTGWSLVTRPYLYRTVEDALPELERLPEKTNSERGTPSSLQLAE